MRSMPSSFAVWTAALGVAVALLARAAASEPVDFDRDVRPIFAKNCSGCHFPEAGSLKGKLDLSTAAATLAGGKSGPSVILGNAQDSPLVGMVEHRIEPYMPPVKKGAKLSDRDVAILRRWIDEGAAVSAPAEPESVGMVASPAAVSSRSLPTAVTSLAFHPGRDKVILARGGLHVVDLLAVSQDTGELTLERSLPDHAEMVRALAFSPDGGLLAAGGGKPGRGGEVRLWSTADWSLVRSLDAHRDNVLAVAFSHDGALLATSSYDKTVAVWDVASGERRLLLDDHVDAVYAVAFSPDGLRLATGAGDRTIKIWDVRSGAMVLTLADSLDAVLTVAYSPDGSRLAGAGADKIIRVWDMSATEGPIQQSSATAGILLNSTFAHGGAILHLVYSPDGTVLYSTSEDKLIKAWQADSLAEKWVFETQSDWVTSMALSADGTLLAAGRYDATTTLYAAATGARLEGALGREATASAATSSSGRRKVTSLDVEAVIIEATIPPSVASITPSLWHRGAETEVIVEGKNIDHAEPIVTNAKMTATLVNTEALPAQELKLPSGPRGTSADVLDNARPYRLKVKLAIADDAPVGPTELMFRTPLGMSNSMSFTVIPRPDILEAPETEGRESLQTIAWPAVVSGQIRASGDVDRYRFEVKAGDEPVFVLTDTTIHPAMRLLDDAGRLLTASDGQDATSRDRLAHRFEADGACILEVSDSELRAGLGYRLHVGAFPLVTGLWPLGVPAGAPTQVEVEGFNLGATRTLQVDPPDVAHFGLTMPLPVHVPEGSPLPVRPLAVGPFPEQLEEEPDDEVGASARVPTPCTVNGRITSGGDTPDSDLYRFAAKKGESLVIEVEAARLGSTLDSLVEVLDSEGRLLPRGLVRCVAETFITLSGRDSKSGGFRVDSWRDFKLNDFALAGAEIVQVTRLPGYADEDMSLRTYPNGQRMAYFGTTPEHHAVNAKVYKVEVHPPEATFAPNGMPLYPLYWRNDDGFFEDGKASGDSYLIFEPPADGEYVVRVSDARGLTQGDRPYRLTLRPLLPDYSVVAGPGRINVANGSRVPIDVVVFRRDGFGGPIDVTAVDVPEGFSVSSGRILENEHRVRLVLEASPQAVSMAIERGFKIVAEATIDGRDVRREAWLGAITVMTEQPDLVVANGESAVTIAPGKSGWISVRLDRFNGYDGRVPIEVLNLPYGVRVLDTGLNGILVREGEHDRRMELYVEPWVRAMERDIYIQALIEAQSPQKPVFVSAPITLRIGEREVRASH